jgi:hypothetical protein
MGRMKRILALALLLAAGCLPEQSAGAGPMARLFGSQENVDIVASPDYVQAFRLRPESGLAYADYPVVVGPVKVPSSIASRFSNGLTNRATYDHWDQPKACEPRPGLKLRFVRDGRGVEVVFCLECDILFTSRGDVSIGYANFDEHHDQIVKLFIEMFPNDATLPPLLRQKS